MRSLLALLVLLPALASASGSCRPASDKVLGRIELARVKALNEAAKAKHWVVLTAMEKRLMPMAMSKDGGTDERTIELSIGKFEQNYGPTMTYVMDERTRKVFAVMELPKYTGEPVTFCGCAPPGHGGAEMPQVEYVVRVPKGAVLVQTKVPTLAYEVPAEQVSYSRNDCPPPP